MQAIGEMQQARVRMCIVQDITTALCLRWPGSLTLHAVIGIAGQFTVRYTGLSN